MAAAPLQPWVNLMFRCAPVRPAITALILVFSLCCCALAHAKVPSCLDPPLPMEDGAGLSLKGPARMGGARLISVLVEIDACSRNVDAPGDARSLLTLHGGNARISVHLSLFAMEVSVGKDADNAARAIDIQLLQRYIPLGIKYLVFNIYVSPGSGGSASPGQVIVKANEAMVRGTEVLVGREIADPIRPFSLEGLDALLDSDISITSEQEGGRLLRFARQSLIPVADMPGAGQ